MLSDRSRSELLPSKGKDGPDAIEHTLQTRTVFHRHDCHRRQTPGVCRGFFGTPLLTHQRGLSCCRHTAFAKNIDPIAGSPKSARGVKGCLYSPSCREGGCSRKPGFRHCLPALPILGNYANPRSYRPGFLQGYLAPSDRAGVLASLSGLQRSFRLSAYRQST